MDLKEFAEANRLRPRRDEDGSSIIPGKEGHIYQHGTERFGVVVFDQTPRKWAFRKRACTDAGMDLYRDGDYEGICIFDPSDPVQVEVALFVARIHRKRRVSPEQLEHLRAMAGRTQIRKNSPLEGVPTPENAREGTSRGSGKGNDLSTVSDRSGGDSEAA